MKNKSIYSEKDYGAMVEALEIKGFTAIGDKMWMYRNKGGAKFINVRIDFAGYIVVNFNNATVKSLTPKQVLEGLNYLKGKGSYPVLFVG